MKKLVMTMIILVFAGVIKGYSEEPVNTLSALTKTVGEISSINMDKDYSKAQTILDNFYTGDLSKKEKDAEPVYIGTGENNKSAIAITVKPAATRKLAFDVPPLGPRSNNKQENSGIPTGAGLLASGVVVLAIVGCKKSYLGP